MGDTRDYKWLHAVAEKRIEKFVAKIDRMTALLKRCEWIQDSGYVDPYCPICLRDKSEGHSPDCELGKEVGS